MTTLVDNLPILINIRNDTWEITMRKRLFFKDVKNRLKVNMLKMACIFITALLIGACANETKRQMSPLANEAGQISAEGDTENAETAKDQEVICRITRTTGTRFSHKVCATKAQWAKLQKKRDRKTDEFQRAHKKRIEGLDTGPEMDAAGGMPTGPPR
jgi:hypothetical protein